MQAIFSSSTFFKQGHTLSEAQPNSQRDKCLSCFNDHLCLVCVQLVDCATGLD